VGQADRVGRIVEVRGPGGAPPYVVRFEDGHEGLVFPGPDAVIEAGADRLDGPDFGAAPDSLPNR
jgi:Domain of unknown function (DUF1918)